MFRDPFFFEDIATGIGVTFLGDRDALKPTNILDGDVKAIYNESISRVLWTLAKHKRYKQWTQQERQKYHVLYR